MIRQVVILLIAIQYIAAGQEYFQQYVNYQIDAKLIIDDNSIDASQNLYYVNNSPDTLSEIYFHLYLNKYDSDAYTNNGKLRKSSTAFIEIFEFSINGLAKEDFEIYKTLMKVKLDSALAPGDTMQFDFVFNSKLPPSSSRYGYLGDHYDVGNWFPTPVVYDREGWHLHQHIDNEFYQEWGDFKVNLTVPKGFIVGATGNLINSASALQDTSAEVRKWFLHNVPQADSTTTWKYEAKKVHDFAWTADPDYRYITSEWNGIKIHHLVMRYNYDDWKKETKAAVEGMRFLSEMFGPYPYEQITIADTYITAGGMEYPNIVFINTFGGPASELSYFRAVVIHEIAHNWFYGLLASNQTEYEWMDEGFTQFAEILALEDIFGFKNNNFPPSYGWFTKTFSFERNAREISHLRALRLAKSNKEKDAVNTRPDWFGYGVGYSQYDKMSTILFMLENTMGKADFWKGMKDYVKSWSLKHPQPQDFKQAMEKAANSDLDWFFNQWLNTVQQLDYGVKELSSLKSNNEYIVHFEIENLADIHMPVDIMFILANGDSVLYHIPIDHFSKRSPERNYLREWHFSLKTYSEDIILSAEVDEIIIDPFNALTDINKLNNNSRLIPKMDFHFLDRQSRASPLDKYLWETWPGIFYNDIDKIKIGLANYGGYLGSDHLIDFKVWYKTNTSNLDYSFLHRTPLRWLNQSAIYSKMYSIDGRQGANLEIRTRKPGSGLHTLKIDHYSLFDKRYTDYPWQAGTINSISYGMNYTVSKVRKYSAFVLRLKNALAGSSSNFSMARIDFKQTYNSQYSDYIFDFNLSAGAASTATPIQERFNLAGANGVEEFNEPYYRSRGTLPVQWKRNGNLYMNRNARVRGVSLINPITPYVIDNNILVSSIDFTFPNIFNMTGIYQLDVFDNSLFIDMGAVWQHKIPDFKEFVKSAGVTISYSDFYNLNYILAIDEISLDFPLWIGRTFEDYEDYEFRWLISFKFDYNYNFVF